ncbi:hypothetical protein EYF80_045454 [Liparis tanakae]|uniref:Uncharacterized protein n=1 Tax=Liparis tanakae TaxID=230148 RepID=A0A4Z2FVJ1_9TELE|nr:hypothetical protein EYF80_045454 [Liparis tanakae]
MKGGNRDSAASDAGVGVAERENVKMKKISAKARAGNTAFPAQDNSWEDKKDKTDTGSIND